MITSVFLNLIYLFFPLGCYLIYIIYSKVTYEKEKKLFFILSAFSSCYLCTRFGDKTSISFLAINIPLILCIYKKNITFSAILSFFLSNVFAELYGVNIIIYFLLYFLIIVTGYYFNKFNIVNVFMFYSTIFNVIVIFFLTNKFYFANNYLYIILSLVFIYLCLLLTLNLYEKLDTIIKMYYSLEEITKEKMLYQSLFKITHEIKNPLAVCKGYLDMFDIRNPSKANKYIGIINQEIDRTLVLLKDFSDISKIKVDKNIMDANMLLEDVCDESKLIFKNNISFNYNLCKKEVNIFGDYNRLKQVLINVVKNAKEAITDNGKVSIESKCKNGKYIIIVKDNGCGMSKEVKEQIGNPFYTTKKNGTGLGVCFSREIIEMHKGSIRYLSKEGLGTEVRITLPLKNA